MTDLGPRPRLRRAAWLAAAAVVSGLAVYGVAIEPQWVEVTHHEAGARSAGASRIRIAQLSDLHLRGVGRRERRVAEPVRAQKVDVVLLTGDIIDSRHGIEVVPKFLGLIGPGPRLFAVPGNWDYWSGVPIEHLKAALSTAGGALLVNSSARLPSGATLVGFDDWTAGHPKPSRACATALFDPTRTLLITHSPALRDELPGCGGAAVMLAGHTHGGQVTFFGWAPLTPTGGGDYVRGWYRGAPVDLFVSRGIGTSVLPVRVGARPEIALIDWWVPAPGEE